MGNMREKAMEAARVAFHACDGPRDDPSYWPPVEAAIDAFNESISQQQSCHPATKEKP